MLTILHISDLHFGPPFVHRIGDALLEIAPKLGPGAIVVSGDLTQRAKQEQFADARDFFDRLPSVPKMIVPGNHGSLKVRQNHSAHRDSSKPPDDAQPQALSYHPVLTETL